jgi:hypothetical protein
LRKIISNTGIAKAEKDDKRQKEGIIQNGEKESKKDSKVD